MDAITALQERRSIRKYRQEKVDRKLMTEIIDITRWAPSWANYQIARWTLVDDQALIDRLMADGVKGFAYNIKTLKNAKGVAVLSFVQGKSGRLKESEGFASDKGDLWEVFDAGIACQTFCLAAHAKGVGTCIMGVINSTAIAAIVDLPENETVAALITYGYPDEEVKPTPRKSAEEIMRFAG